MDVNADINNGGENTPASGLELNASNVNFTNAAAGTFSSRLVSSAVTAQVAGQETLLTQRCYTFHPGNPSERINQPGSETASRYNSPFENYHTLADFQHHCNRTFPGGFNSPRSPGRTSFEHSFRTGTSPGDNNNKVNDSMLRINSSLFKYTIPVIPASNPLFGYIKPIQSLRSIRKQILPETLLNIYANKTPGPPRLEENCTLLQFHDWQMSLFYM